MRPACAPSRSCARISSRPIFSPAPRSRTPSSPARRSAARPMRRSISMPSRGMSASRLTIEDWETIGYDVPLLVNMQPAGEYLGEEYFRAGGLPAVMHELLAGGTAARRRAHHQRQDRCRECGARQSQQCRGHLALRQADEGQSRLQGAARQSVRFGDHEDQRDLRRIPPALSCPIRRIPNAFEGRAVVFDGPEDYHHRIDDPALGIDEHTILFMRGAGPIGYPGSAEVVNMQPPAALIKKGVTALACIGDGRQSGTSGSPSILNASPEAAAGGGLGAAQDRRPRAHRSQQRHRRYADFPAAELAERARGAEERTAAIIIRRARRRGRKSSAPWSISSPTAWCWSRRSSISASRKNSCRATITDVRSTPNDCETFMTGITSVDRRQAQDFPQAARSRLLRHSQSVERRQRALSARPRLSRRWRPPAPAMPIRRALPTAR